MSVRGLAVTTLIFGFACLPAIAASVGSGSPNQLIQQSFIVAFNRGPFGSLVLLPTKDVRAFGTPGLVQEFPAKVGTSTFALVKPDPTVPAGGLDTLQVYGDLYAYYNSIGVSVVGYPINDTTPCPANILLGSCEYQTFTKNYALFVYPAQATNFTVKDPFFTEWNNDGAIGVMGAAAGVETAVVSLTGAQGTQQLFSAGTIFSYPAGSTSPVTIGIAEPLNSAFISAGGYGQLGFPTSEAITVPGGLVRQTFEKGRIEVPPGGAPVVLFSISLLGISGEAQGLTLAVGASATLSAFVDDTRNQPVSGRALSWSTSNGSVARVTGHGDTATVQAVGPGAANIYVSGEGITSLPFNVRVGAVCCAIGEGAPSAAISQAFQTAVQRNNLLLQPAAAPVTRSGSGYVQTVNALDGSAYVISDADNASTAYVIGGSLYSAYLANGGFAGALGYPASDAVGGAQRFTSGAALGGTPVRVVPALVAAKWFQLGGAAGLVGPPVADPVTSLSSGGVGVLSQNFAGGTLFDITNGSRTGQAFFSSGPILTRYLALSGPAGVLGAPASDVIPSGQAATETFENGFIDLQPGASSAIEHLNPRHPAITATPSSVTPGGRIHISASGFAPGATLAFTITGQLGFSVAAASGAFAWDLVIPLGAAPGTVSVSTTAQGSSDSAAATYNITSVPASRPVLTIVSGDRQTGLPGSTLALPIIALLQDSAGNPLQGVPVAFDSSPGASAQSSFVTGPDGEVSVGFRLPLASGVAVGSLKAGAQVANFSAIATSGTIGGFPVFTQSDAHGAFVAGLASLIRYFQNAGLLPAPNGLATPAALNQFLVPGSGAPEISNPSIVNPWIAAKFALAGVFVESTALDHVRDLINSGSPVAILLNLAVDGTVSGGTTVDAIGISDDGSIIIEDPNPSFGRSSLNDYLNGFSAQGHQIVGVAAAVLRIGTASLPASAMPFTISSPIQAGAAIASPAGMCSLLDVPDGERFQYCDGVQAKYELDFTTPLGAGIVDLTGGPGLQVAANGGVSWALARDVGQLKIAPQVLTVDAVTDSAAFTAGLSPGGLITLFGSGFGSAAGTTVTLDGAKLPVLAAFPFQINTQIPPGAASGSAQLQVSGALGTASKSVTVLPWAPGIFTIGAQGATINQDGSLNSASTPAQRGQYISVYCSGLGATAPQGGLQWTATTVTAMVNGASLIPSFSGLAPGFIGVYQVNVTIPANSPPSLAGTLAIREGGQNSNSVPLAVQ